MKNSTIATFYLNNDRYGIPVEHVQEVTGQIQPAPTPLAPSFVNGLINLRGQIATAIDLKELLKLPKRESSTSMSVVCRIDGNLVSLIVDSIDEVMDVANLSFEKAPDTVDGNIRKYLSGIYKANGLLLSCFDVEKIGKDIFYNTETAV